MEDISLERRFLQKMEGRYKIIVSSFQTFTPGCGDENKNTSQKFQTRKADCDVVVVLHFGRRTE